MRMRKILAAAAVMLLCAALFACQILVVDHFVPHVDCVRLSCLQFLVVGVVSLAMAALLGEPLSLDALSKELDISPYYFSKLFKEETGSNFVEYLTNLRMSRAKELLKDESRSMKEICMEVGYSDPNYFSRIFKKNVGLTPTEYREREKG